MKINKGYLNIFVHGVAQNRFFFEKTIQMLKDNSEKKDVIDIGVVTFRKELNGSVSSQVNSPWFFPRIEAVKESLNAYINRDFNKLEEPVFFPSKEFLQLTESMGDLTLKSKIKLLTEKGYNLGLRYEGSEITDSTLNLNKELRKVVRTFLPYDTKHNLIGHSRGGLACLSYALTYPDDVNKVITIGTPFAGNIIAKYLGENVYTQNFVKSDRIALKEMAGSTPFLKELCEKWNNEGKNKIDFTAIGFDSGFGADSLVDVRSQLALYKGESTEYKNVNRVLINDSVKSCLHSTASKNPILIHHLNNLIRQPKEILLEKDTSNGKYTTILDKVAGDPPIKVADISQKLLRVNWDNKHSDFRNR